MKIKFTFWSLLCFFIISHQLSGQNATLDHLFYKNEKVPLLVVFKQQADYTMAYQLKNKVDKTHFVYKEAQRVHNNTLSQFVKLCEIKPITSFAIANSVVVEVNFPEYLLLNTQPMIQNILADIPKQRFEVMDYREEILPSQRSQITTWGIKDSKADSVWLKGYTGQGIVVGGQDTGYQSGLGPIKRSYRGYVNDTTSSHQYHWHDAIRERNTLNADDNNPCGFNSKVPCDDNNHGTHTMGTMVGRDTNEIVGVAPDARWVGCRNMDRGWGKPSSYLECFEWFLAPTDLDNKNPKPELAPDVINNSWGCPEVEGCNASNWQVMQRVVIALKAAGIFVVVSAGNSGPNCNTIDDPAAFFKESFTVGAHNISGGIAGFSSRGASSYDTVAIKPDITAPGVGVRSLLRNGTYANFNGTSMAGPHVAGAVALILSAVPALKGKVEIVEDILKKSARPNRAEKSCGGVDSLAIPNNTFGHGRLDILKALQLAQTYQVTNEEEIALNLIEIYPNPTSDYFYIKGLDDAPFDLRIYDMTGKLVMQSVETSPIIYLPAEVIDNVYFCKIEQKGSVMMNKVVVWRGR